MLTLPGTVCRGTGNNALTGGEGLADGAGDGGAGDGGGGNGSAVDGDGGFCEVGAGGGDGGVVGGEGGGSEGGGGGGGDDDRVLAVSSSCLTSPELPDICWLSPG